MWCLLVLSLVKHQSILRGIDTYAIIWSLAWKYILLSWQSQLWYLWYSIIDDLLIFHYVSGTVLAGGLFGCWNSGRAEGRNIYRHKLWKYQIQIVDKSNHLHHDDLNVRSHPITWHRNTNAYQPIKTHSSSNSSHSHHWFMWIERDVVWWNGWTL